MGTAIYDINCNWMLLTFTSIRFPLMVGIRGGEPSEKADIHVVASKPTEDFGGVVQYDFGKTVGQGAFEHTGRLNRPHQMLLTAISGSKRTICP